MEPNTAAFVGAKHEHSELLTQLRHPKYPVLRKTPLLNSYPRRLLSIYDLLSTIYSIQLMMPLSRPAKIPARVLACLAFVFASIVTPAFMHRVLPTLTIADRSASAQADTRLSGDYDYYVMLGAAPNGGFEARRRMGFAHFDGPGASSAWFKRRRGARFGFVMLGLAPQAIR